MTKKAFTRNELVDMLKTNLHTVFELFNVDFAVLADSSISEKQQWLSNIDIFIHLPKNLGLSDDGILKSLNKIKKVSDKLMHLDKLKLHILEKQSLHTQFHVLSDGIIIFEAKTGCKNIFLENFLPAYEDYKIWIDRLSSKKSKK